MCGSADRFGSLEGWTAAVAAAASSHGLQYQVAALKPLKLSCMTVPPFDLSVQLSDLGDDLEHAVLDVLRSGQYIGGPVIQGFEKAFATACLAAASKFSL